jgi:glycosyltransferase involved in cell wall biosynthesis
VTISVVIPCYNREAILGRAIRSALSQTVSLHEIVVIDDGSRDASAEVARSFGGIVRVISQPNAGAAAARNRGIRESSGDWIAFLDSDDEWAADKLDRQLAATVRFPNAKLVFCDTSVRMERSVIQASRFAEGGLYGAEVEKSGEAALYDRSLFSRMINQSRVITSAVLVRNRLPELSFPEHIWGAEDWALWLRLAARHPFASVDAVLVTMHQQGDNLTGRKGRLYRNDLKVLEELIDDPAITNEECEAVRAELARRRVGAVYYSLIAGEGRDVRDLLSSMNFGELGLFRHYVYKILSYAPPSVIRRLAETKRHLST